MNRPSHLRTDSDSRPRRGHGLAVLAAARTPFAKAFTEFRDHSAVTLGAAVTRDVLRRADLDGNAVDEVVFGNVAGPPDAANIGRVIALTAGIPQDRPAHTVNRNCGSGLETLIAAGHILAEGRADVVLAGGTESMSNIPLLFRPSAAAAWSRLARSKTWAAKLAALAAFRPQHFRPLVGIELGLTDPTCGLNMGQTAEVLADEFGITREEQDRYAAESHRRASETQRRCFLSGEIIAIDAQGDPVRRDSPDEGQAPITAGQDNAIRHAPSMEQLAKLRPIFRPGGSVTAGNSCGISDGAAAAILVRPADVSRFDSPPLGYITGYAVAGCDPKRMGLGPVYATAKLLRQSGRTLEDFDRIELNEAFAAQVLACGRAAESAAFARRELGADRPLGKLVDERTNVHGGAIAIGHPVGATGLRLVLTLLRALRESGQRRGLVTLCVGGGQGMAITVETEQE